MQTINILHLEDSDHDAELTKALVEGCGLNVHIKRAISEASFLSLLDNEQIDLILSDFTIPSFGGIEALKIASEKYPRVPFIFFSGTMGEDAAVESLRHGATDYVLKGKPMRLVPAIHAALELAEIREQQAIANNLRRFQSNILRSVTDGVIVTRLDGEVTYWNEGARVILKLHSDAVIGHYLEELALGSGAHSFQGLFQDCKVSGHAMSEFPCEVGDTESYVSVKASLLRAEDAKPSGCLFIVRDITDLKKSETALKLLNGELEQRVSDRTEALTAVIDELKSFSYSVSHDLRGPLRAILGYTRVLEEDYGDKLDQDGMEVLGRVSAAGKRMDALINGLLQLSMVRRSEFSRSKCDLSELARSISDELSSNDPRPNAIWRIQDGVGANADQGMVRSVLQNLLSNAWKFSSKTPEPVVEFGADKVEGQIVFYVRDNGIGFEPEQCERIFEPFKRMHSEEEYKGTGIGLATVNRIIQRHGGSVWARSKPGEGSTFFFTLEASAPA